MCLYRLTTTFDCLWPKYIFPGRKYFAFSADFKCPGAAEVKKHKPKNLQNFNLKEAKTPKLQLSSSNRHDWQHSTPLQRCSVGSGSESSITGDHGWANIKPKNTRASGHPEQPSRHSHNHTSVRAAREELHPWVCDPSNGKWCIIEERAGELMKRVARWHFQSDVWSRMTFTEKKPKRQSVRKKKRASVYYTGVAQDNVRMWSSFQHDSDSLAELSFMSSGSVIWLDGSESFQLVIDWIWEGRMTFKSQERRFSSADEFRYFYIV